MSGTCMMPLNAGEYTEEGMIPCPSEVRLILLFFGEEEDLVGGTNADTFCTPPLVETTEKIETKDVLSFIIYDIIK